MKRGHGGVEVRFVNAQAADAKDLTWADGLILGTPENFGYMSGMMKDFFERTFYEVEGKILKGGGWAGR